MADEAYPLPGVTTMSTLAEWEAFFTPLGLDGVIRGTGNELVGSLNSGARTAVVGTGAANIRGFHKPVTSATSTAIPAASAQNRVDRLVLRLDRTASAAANFIKPAVITGTSGSTTPPALQATTSGLWDLPICRWTSASNGALSGLTDERYWADGSFNSTSRPPAAPARFGIELDTGPRTMWANGTTWSPITLADTGELGLTVGYTSAWSTNGAFVGRKVGSIVDLTINLQRINTTWTSNDTDGTHLATIPTTLRPYRYKYFGVQFTGAIGARVEVRSDGTVWALHNDGNVAPGRILRCTLTYIP